jgi:chromosome segregation ATPase
MHPQSRAPQAERRRAVRRLRAERDAAHDDMQAFAAIGSEADDEYSEAKRDHERLKAEVEQAEARLCEAQEAGA